jgi:NH3-dependent NAD+ synthetase
LRNYLKWNGSIGVKFVDSVLHADPTAELTPLKAGKIAQNDEEDMGITY